MSLGLFFSDLRGKRILLAVSGGIAAYKAAELCRLLVRSGAEVQVLMTDAAQHFVGQATFAALSGRRVATSLFDAEQEATIGHIKIAEQHDVLVVAPASANTIAKMAHGLADNLLSTVYLAFTGTAVIAPAMNVQMWQHCATKQNVDALRERDHLIVGPAVGDMACGHHGAGRMVEADQVLQAVVAAATAKTLRGKRIVVSAGPTREAIDPVRFMTNRSSGKMGYALAAVAASRGAEVTLISGPTALPVPYGVACIRVTSAAEMAGAVYRQAERSDALLMTAAVADYSCEAPAAQKLKKNHLGDTFEIKLGKTEDILRRVGQMRAASGRAKPLMVGFAAETDKDVARAAREKLEAKQCEIVVANPVGGPEAGFEVETNRALICTADGQQITTDLIHKRELAVIILDQVERLFGSELNRA